MTRPIPWSDGQRRKVIFSAAATLLALAEIGWWLPAARLPHATLPTHLLAWLRLALPAILTLLAARSGGSETGARGWVY